MNALTVVRSPPAMCFAAGDAALQFQYCVARTVVHRVLCTSQENSRPKTFRKNAKKAKNAKKPYFYKVKRRKITHADAKKCEKWEQMLFVLLFSDIFLRQAMI